MRRYKRELAYRIPLVVHYYINHGGYDYAICPRCKCSLDREYMRFCDRCGQKLNWHKFSEIRKLAPNH